MSETELRASPITPCSASLGSSLRHGQVVPRSNTNLSIAALSARLRNRSSLSRRTRCGANSSMIDVSPAPPCTSGGGAFTVARSCG